MHRRCRHPVSHCGGNGLRPEGRHWPLTEQPKLQDTLHITAFMCGVVELIEGFSRPSGNEGE